MQSEEMGRGRELFVRIGGIVYVKSSSLRRATSRHAINGDSCYGVSTNIEGTILSPFSGHFCLILKSDDLSR